MQNPTDVQTLDAYATFLHRKRGEMGRAEAFYRRFTMMYCVKFLFLCCFYRALQCSVPSLVTDIMSLQRDSPHEKHRLFVNDILKIGSSDGYNSVATSGVHPSICIYLLRVFAVVEKVPLYIKPETIHSMIKLKVVSRLLLNYATFLRRAKGDLEIAEMALRKAAEVLECLIRM